MNYGLFVDVAAACKIWPMGRSCTNLTIGGHTLIKRGTTHQGCQCSASLEYIFLIFTILFSFTYAIKLFNI